jgi:hypothetical protein
MDGRTRGIEPGTVCRWCGAHTYTTEEDDWAWTLVENESNTFERGSGSGTMVPVESLADIQALIEEDQQRLSDNAHTLGGR